VPSEEKPPFPFISDRASLGNQLTALPCLLRVGVSSVVSEVVKLFHWFIPKTQ
jgi:hypothetical protein